MGSKGGGGGSTTTVQKADPWVGLQPGLKQLYDGATNWYNGPGPQYYPGQTLAGTNQEIEGSLNAGVPTAQQNYANVTQAGSQLAQTAQGRSPWENPGHGTLQQFASGANIGTNPAQGLLGWFSDGNQRMQQLSGESTQQQLASNSGLFGQQAAGEMMGKNTANPMLQATANGDYLTDKTNPYLRGLFENATDPIVDQFKNAIAPGLASQFAGAGRTGSGASAQAFDAASGQLGRTLSQTATGLYGGAYENERQRQQQAMGALSANYNTERGMQMQGAGAQLGAAQGLSGLDFQKTNQQLAGINSLAGLTQSERQAQLTAAQAQSGAYGLERNLQQQAQLAAPQMAAARYADLDKMLGIGEYRRGQEQDHINDARARFDYGQQLPLQKLQALNQLLQGGSVYSGQTSSSDQKAKRNPFGGAMGGASMGSYFGPWGTAIGALVGGLFG